MLQLDVILAELGLQPPFVAPLLHRPRNEEYQMLAGCRWHLSKTTRTIRPGGIQNFDIRPCLLAFKHHLSNRLARFDQLAGFWPPTGLPSFEYFA